MGEKEEEPPKYMEVTHSQYYKGYMRIRGLVLSTGWPYSLAKPISEKKEDNVLVFNPEWLEWNRKQ